MPKIECPLCHSEQIHWIRELVDRHAIFSDGEKLVVYYIDTLEDHTEIWCEHCMQSWTSLEELQETIDYHKTETEELEKMNENTPMLRQQQLFQ